MPTAKSQLVKFNVNREPYFAHFLSLSFPLIRVHSLARVKARACKWPGPSALQLCQSGQVCGIAIGKPFLGIKFHEGNGNSLCYVESKLPWSYSQHFFAYSTFCLQSARQGMMWKKRLQADSVSASKQLSSKRDLKIMRLLAKI